MSFSCEWLNIPWSILWIDHDRSICASLICFSISEQCVAYDNIDISNIKFTDSRAMLGMWKLFDYLNEEADRHRSLRRPIKSVHQPETVTSSL